MFELSAFLHEVQKRLQDVVLHVNEKTWQPLGERYFGLIVRARFATTHRVYSDLLRADGVPARRLKPFAITLCPRARCRAGPPGRNRALCVAVRLRAPQFGQFHYGKLGERRHQYCTVCTRWRDDVQRVQ